jgi:hypothetical protein
MSYLDDLTKKWLDEAKPDGSKAEEYFRVGYEKGAAHLSLLEKKLKVMEDTFDLIINHPVKPGFNVALYCVQLAKQGLVRLKRLHDG